MNLLEILEALNAKGLPFIVPVEEEIPTREEEIDELSPYRHDWPEMPLGVPK